jgi:undecaprenyl diphosphate synthase
MHVAIIMDGNGRWARAGGLARPAGHRAGAAVAEFGRRQRRFGGLEIVARTAAVAS